MKYKTLSIVYMLRVLALLSAGYTLVCIFGTAYGVRGAPLWGIPTFFTFWIAATIIDLLSRILQRIEASSPQVKYDPLKDITN